MNPLLNEEIDISISGFRQLTELVNKQYNFDLSCYALTSFKRRLIKFIERREYRNLDYLMKMIEKDQISLSSLLTGLNVEVTEFFRDPAWWRYFRDEMLPTLAKNHDHIKIWIPGCSTGEEVASTAIVLKEAKLLSKVEIIASDLTNEIISSVKGRIYPTSKFEFSDANYKRYDPEGEGDFSKYIINEKNGFKIPDELFENVSFVKFDYKEDFKNRGINVIICRNNFIYYTSQFQEKMLEIFSGKLSFNGYLIIGNKENIEWCKDMARYTSINDSEKVFRKTSP
ncbi:MAG: CheR family methyltransferase [Bacteroidales bacterium]